MMTPESEVETALGKPRQNRRVEWREVRARDPQAGQYVVGPYQGCLMRQSHPQPRIRNVERDHRRTSVEFPQASSWSSVAPAPCPWSRNASTATLSAAAESPGSSTCQ